MNKSIFVRKFKLSDAQSIAKIYYHTIHTVNAKDYTQEQLDAWAPATCLESDGWLKKWSKVPPLVALIDKEIVGFCEFEPNGHIDCFYVHHEFQACGVGSSLMEEAYLKVKKLKLARIYSEVSITAKPFFEKKGFNVLKQQEVVVRGVKLINFQMEKFL